MDIKTVSQGAKASEIRSILRKLMSQGEKGVRAAAAISSDGLVIASVLQQGVDPDRFAAMSASLLALAERAIEETQRGTMRQLLIEGTNGAVLLVQAGDDAVLAVSTDPGALIGKIFLEARRAASELRLSLESA
ncbi:roadblock/LC7 domain-containing protein [Wenzhouxiangella marina]|uniref:Uncharacterized protein n=1 Tax=Wenzhouxiangella marina TaxID=1579979 RepID=A0A0K0XY32_9GAMM|nr:roadblock/LC7 domain-containing protein [Wenzhouxiangella marina]AKS42604.1 hypothetical protein WM2015_2241 [Wenzhouxiangella marina]MBB6085614.1 hypothetical protein [Wenzhouxiangella marina]